jgi:hypothetical protein
MKLALLILLATLSGCVVKERVKFVPMPPKVTEKVFLIVPSPPQEDEEAKEKIEKNKEAQNFA